MSKNQFEGLAPRDRSKELKHHLSLLAESLITDTTKMLEFAKRWRGGFHNYSFHNLLLIHFQMPTATLCAGFHSWRKYKRWVKKGEKGIWVLAPYIKREEERGAQGQRLQVERLVGFYAVPTFDISQTEGEPLNIGANEAKFKDKVWDIKDIIKPFTGGIDVIISNGIADGKTDGKTIWVSARKNSAQMICSYLHELAHCLIGHQDKESEAYKTSPERKELEAEAVAYLVSACLGIENPDASLYISGWNGSKEGLEDSAFEVAYLLQDYQGFNGGRARRGSG